MTDLCQIPRCRRPADVIYLACGVCSVHWDQLMNENASADALRRALGLAAGPELMENTDMSKKKTHPTEQPVETPQTEVAAAPEKKVKPPKTAKTEKATKPEKKTRAPKEENLVVFAFRLTPGERDVIHKAAGPGGASRFVRAVAIAAAQEDEGAVQLIIKEVRAERG